MLLCQLDPRSRTAASGLLGRSDGEPIPGGGGRRRVGQGLVVVLVAMGSVYRVDTMYAMLVTDPAAPVGECKAHSASGARKGMA